MTAIPVITGGTVDEAASDADLQALTARVAALEAKGSGTTPPPPSGPTPPISLAWTAPAAAASLAGLVPLVLSGSDLVNVEIFDGGTMLIRLTCSPDGTSATGNLDTTALTNGGLTLVATAWNAPAGQGTSTTLTTQAIRNFTVANPASSGGGTIPQSGTITTAMSFTEACAAIGVNALDIYAFGTTAASGAPTIPITNEAQLAAAFNPRDTYNTPFRGANGEWQTYATSLTDTQAFEFTPNSLKLNAYIPAGGGVHAQGITAGQICLKQLLQPGVAPAGNKALAAELVATVPNQVGAWPAFWLYQAFGAGGGPNEIDIMECPVSANGVWGTTKFVDGCGITAPSLHSTIYTSPAFDGFKVPLGFDMALAPHRFQLIWTEAQIWIYLDGVLMFAFNYKYAASLPAELMINLAVGTSTWGQPGMDPTSAAQFPFAYELEQLTIFTA